MNNTADLTVGELLQRVGSGEVPLTARLRLVTEVSAGTAEPQEDPRLALFRQWAEEDAQMTPEERAENDRIYDEIEKNGIPRTQI